MMEARLLNEDWKSKASQFQTKLTSQGDERAELLYNWINHSNKTWVQPNAGKDEAKVKEQQKIGHRT